MKKIISILKLEAVAFFIAAVWEYYLVGASWWMFIVLLLVPDLFMVGYAKNSKVGATIYNIGHTYVAPLLLLLVGWFFHADALYPIGIIWFAHISMDRMLGYGLKHDTHFKDTHLGTIGGDK